MKPFLSVNITDNKKNEIINGEEFSVAKTSPLLTQMLADSTEKANDTLNKSKLPLFFRIIQGISGLAATLIGIGLIRAMTGENSVSITEAYHNAPGIILLFCICLPLWLILKILSSRKEKTVLESPESDQTISNLESVCNSVYTELSVPADAKDVDILAFFYKVKGEDIKPVEKGLQFTPYFNYEFKIYADSSDLYLVNLEGKYRFPLSSLQRIRVINKKIGVSNWNKDDGPDSGAYKKYKMVVNNGCIYFKPYYILELEHEGETWGIYFPCYELDVFEQATGLTAE